MGGNNHSNGSPVECSVKPCCHESAGFGAGLSSVSTCGDLASREKNNTMTAKKSAPGFAAFGNFLASDPDLQIYRKFDKLASRNIGYLQSELMALSAEMEELDSIDRRENELRSEGWMDNQLPARCWEVLERKVEEGSEREVRRMALVKKLRLLLAEYQDALIRQSRMLALDPPLSRSKTALSQWFVRHRPLVGHSYDLLDSDQDLVALRTPPDQDRLTAFMQRYFGVWLQEKKDSHGDFEGVTYFPEKTICHIVSILSVVLSALLLIGAIVALYFARTQGAKLGLIALFTTLFAASIGLLTNARRAEVYASTAAYAAVLVVYVSNGSGQVIEAT